MILEKYRPYYIRNLKLALPVVLTQAGQITVNLADNIMVGRLGTAQLAAVSFANSVFILGMVFCIGFTQGLTPHVGQSFGKGEHDKVSVLLKNSILLNIVVSSILTLFMYGVSFHLHKMGQTEQVLTYGLDYYRILLFSLVPFTIFFGLRQFSEGIGITKYAMYITISANILNILLNWMLIYGNLGFEAMGIKGAATATLISRVIMMISFAVVFSRTECYTRYSSGIKKIKVAWIPIKKIIKTSFPLSLQNVVEITAFSMSAIMIGWLGEVPLASHQIAMSMSSFSFMIALGIGAAATIRVSHQYGFGDYKSMRTAGFASIHLSIAIMTLFGIAYVIFRNFIPSIYTQDPMVIRAASSLLIISALFQVFDAIQLSSLACLRALADVKIPFFQSLFSYYFVSLPLGYFFGFTLDLGAEGVWIGLLLGLLFAGVLFLYRFNSISNKIVRQHDDNL
jgi:MATE family multidrug resistance protein